MEMQTMDPLKKIINQSDKQRHFLVDAVRQFNTDDRTVEVAFSSETPVARWYGNEILDHSPGAVSLDRLLKTGPVLYNHNFDVLIGKVISARVDKDRMARAVIKFARNEEAEERWQDIQDGILTNLSVGYRIMEAVLEKSTSENGEAEGVETYRMTKWEPYELSFVSVPADPEVGVGRSDEDLIDIRKKETIDMPPKVEDANINQDAVKRAVLEIMEESQRSKENGSEQAKLEQARINEITELSRQFNCLEEGLEAIRSGIPIQVFQKEILERNQVKPLSEMPDPNIGMDKRDLNKFSFIKAIRASIDGDWSDAKFEREISNEAAKKVGKNARNQGGFFIPYDVIAQKRDLTLATSAPGGGNLVANNFQADSFIDLLRNKMLVASLGVNVLDGLQGNITIPRQSGGATAYWRAESGAVTESEASFDQVTMSPKSLAALTEVTRELLFQSTPAVEQLVRNDLAAALALEMDRAMINGSGSGNEPRGIMNVVGIGSVVGGTNGAALTNDHLVDLETAVAIKNADIGSIHYLTNTKVRGKAKKTVKFANTANTLWEEGGMLNGYNAAITNQVPFNLTKGTSNGVCSAIIFGNFADQFLGMWNGLEIMTNPYTKDSTGIIRLLAFQDVDTVVRHPESFAAMLDCLTT